jgi:CcmD family protein
MDNVLYLATAYMIIWGVLFTYLLFADRRQTKLSRKVRLLEESLYAMRRNEK